MVGHLIMFGQIPTLPYFPTHKLPQGGIVGLTCNDTDMSIDARHYKHISFLSSTLNVLLANSFNIHLSVTALDLLDPHLTINFSTANYYVIVSKHFL